MAACAGTRAPPTTSIPAPTRIGHEIRVADYAEFYLGGGYGPLDVKYWWSPDLYDTSETASYLEANAQFRAAAGFGLNLHYGYSFGDYFDELEDDASASLDPEYDGDDADYADFSVGLTRTFGHFDTELKVVTTDTDDYFEVDSGAELATIRASSSRSPPPFPGVTKTERQE